MKSLRFVILMVLPLISIANAQQTITPGVVSGGVTHAMLPWFKNSFLEIADDVDEASENNKHVLLFFHLEGCPYCDQMVKDFDTKPLKNFIQQHFDVLALNIRGDKEVALNDEQTLSEKQLATQIGVQYTPTVVFLNQNNEVVARTNGYRSPNQLKQVLNYVNTKAYQQLTLAKFIEKTKKMGAYELQYHAMFEKIKDFSTIKTPLAVIFEDKNCETCAYFYDTTLKNKEIKNAFNTFRVVRLDADSTQTLINNKGEKTTPKNWAQQLELNYRPGIILFNGGREITRIDGFLYPFHFKEVLRYVGADFYQEFATFGNYLTYRQKQLLEQGVNINVNK